MWWNRKKTSINELNRDIERMRKIKESQESLLNAAKATANVAEDVTSKLKARLDDSLRQLEMTAGLLSDALIICRADGTINSINSAAERIFGWTHDDLNRKNVSMLFRSSKNHQVTADEIWGCLSEPDDETSETHFKVEGVRGRRKDGELFYVDGDITYLERQDGVTIVMALVKDITTRIELQKQLHVNETKYRSIFESYFDGILVVQNFYVVAANPAIGRMLGYSTEEMIAKTATTFFDQSSHKAINDVNVAYLNGKPLPCNLVVRGTSAFGETVELLFTSTLMTWEGKPATLIALKDITDIINTINSK